MTSDPRLERFYAFLSRPLFFRARFALALAVVPLVLSFAFPLWQVRIEAPPYAQELTLDVYAHTVRAGNDGRDLREINVLHHYVGMREIDQRELGDLDWLPLAFGILAILTLRCAAIGDVRALVDLSVTTGFIGLFAVVRFVVRLRAYGHDLSPDAPLKVPPFSPVVVGTQRVGNFVTTSQLSLGTFLVVAFAVAVTAITVWHLVAGRREAAREAT